MRVSPTLPAVSARRLAQIDVAIAAQKPCKQFAPDGLRTVHEHCRCVCVLRANTALQFITEQRREQLRRHLDVNRSASREAVNRVAETEFREDITSVANQLVFVCAEAEPRAESLVFSDTPFAEVVADKPREFFVYGQHRGHLIPRTSLARNEQHF